MRARPGGARPALSAARPTRCSSCSRPASRWSRCWCTSSPSAASWYLTIRSRAHWPEFGQPGKQAITIRQVLQHRSGLPVARSMARDALAMTDWTASVRALEGPRPRYPPGSVARLSRHQLRVHPGRAGAAGHRHAVRDVLHAELLGAAAACATPTWACRRAVGPAGSGVRPRPAEWPTQADDQPARDPAGGYPGGQRVRHRAATWPGCTRRC